MILRLRADAGHIPLADGSAHCVVTSPPYYGLRKYAGVPDGAWGGDPAHAHEWGAIERGKKNDRRPAEGFATNDALGAREFAQGGAPLDGGRLCACGSWRGCLGNEPTVDLYVAHIVECFAEVRRVLRDDGVCWLNLGDSFASGSRTSYDGDAKAPTARDGDFRTPSAIPAGNLLGVPWRVALALQADGWLLRNDVVWAKRACMPESVAGVRWERCRVRIASKDMDAIAPQKSDTAAGTPQKGLAGHSGGAGVYIPAATWADCPGCAACAPNDGFVLRRGSWRHTRATESVFMLVKSMQYFCDAEAVAEQVSEASIARVSMPTFDTQQGGEKDYGHGTNASRSARRTLENFAASVANGTARRNPRSFMLLSPEPLREAHYAAMPTALVEPLLLASTSAKGVCRACGSPWARVVDKSNPRLTTGWYLESQQTPKMQRADEGVMRNDFGGARTGLAKPGWRDLPVAESRTIGWRATCACDAGEPVPATVLDPFAGSGTTLRVAVQHRRRAVGCDLSQSYLRDIADARTRNVQVELAL